MCKKILPTYTTCGHSAKKNPDIVISFLDKCNKSICPGVTEGTEQYDGMCPNCNTVDTFKHCYWAELCQVEFGHSYTDLPRLPDDEDIVLVTPKDERCRMCIENSYNRHPADPDNIANTSSVMPAEYEGLSRKSFAAMASSRPSVMTSVVLRGMAVDEFRKSQRPVSEVEDHKTQKKDASRTNLKGSGSRAPASAHSAASRAPSRASGAGSRGHGQSRQPSSSQLSSSSNTPSNRLTSKAAPSRHEASSRKEPDNKPPTASAALRRGPPKNVNASAFYDNSEKQAAREAFNAKSTAASSTSNHLSTSKKSAAATSSTSGSNSTLSSTTQAPPADTPSMDLAELLSKTVIDAAAAAPPRITVTPPSNSPSQSQSKNESKTSGSRSSQSKGERESTTSRARESSNASIRHEAATSSRQTDRQRGSASASRRSEGSFREAVPARSPSGNSVHPFPPTPSSPPSEASRSQKTPSSSSSSATSTPHSQTQQPSTVAKPASTVQTAKTTSCSSSKVLLPRPPPVHRARSRSRPSPLRKSYVPEEDAD